MTKKFLSCSVIVVILLLGCGELNQPKLSTKADSCNDTEIKLDIIQTKKAIPKDEDGEIRLKNVYCHNNTLTAIFEIDTNSPKKIAMKTTKKNFDDDTKKYLTALYCTDPLSKLYRKKDVSVKWQYFFKNEKELYSEIIVGNKLCQ